jgi:calcineurin-like phosphoesterase family protein
MNQKRNRAMGRTWYTSDCHFQHKYVAGLRGFYSGDDDGTGRRLVTPEDVQRHDETLITRWNDRVRRDDTVWCLGDFSLGNLATGLEIARSLNGTIHLVTGNHDRAWPGDRDSHRCQRKYMDVFASVQPFARSAIAGKGVLLSHFPYKGEDDDHTPYTRYPQYRLPDEGVWLLHGHTHGKERRHGHQIHVGADAWDLAPVPLEEIEQLIKTG